MSTLSEVGLGRREEGLEALKVVVRARGRRRVVVRAAGALVVMLVVGALVAVMVRGGGNAGMKQEIVMGPEPEAPVAPAGSDVVQPEVRVATLAGISIVKTDPLAVREYAASARPVARLDDAGLQRALREAGKPAGIVRIGKRVMVEGEYGRTGEGM